MKPSAPHTILAAAVLLALMGCAGGGSRSARTTSGKVPRAKIPSWIDTNGDGVVTDSERQQASRKIAAHSSR